MGKRKKATKVQGPKRNNKLPTTFQCLFCNHEHSVSVSIEKKSGVGNLQCKVCGQTFQTTINYLSAPVDVYADWHDACDAVAEEKAKERTTLRGGVATRPTAAAATRGGGGDNFIVDDEQDAEGEYEE